MRRGGGIFKEVRRIFVGVEVRLGEQVLGLGAHAFLGIGLEGVMVVLGGGLDNWVTAGRFETVG